MPRFYVKHLVRRCCEKQKKICIKSCSVHSLLSIEKRPTAAHNLANFCVMLKHPYVTELQSCKFSSLILAPWLHQSLISTDVLPWRKGSSVPAAATSLRWTEPRPLGVWNSGQSCHLGATIAALGAVPMLREWLKYQRSITDSPFSLLRRFLLDSVTSSSNQRPLDPRPLLSMLENSGWKSRHAQDAHETMARLLEILDDWCTQISAKDEEHVRVCKGVRVQHEMQGNTGRVGSQEVQIPPRRRRAPFSAMLTTRKRCYRCGYKGPMSFQSSSMLMLPAPTNDVSLGELIVKTYMSSERVEMRCDQCLRVGTHNWMSGIKGLPDVLVVQLQKAVYARGGLTAATGEVAIPQILVLPIRSYDGNIRRFESFSLRSVVHHKGGMGRESHFDSVVAQDCDDCHFGLLACAPVQRWWHVNDSVVEQCNYAVACNPQLAYMVIYEKRKSIPEKEMKMVVFAS